MSKTETEGRVSALFNEWAQAGRGESMARGHWPRASQILEKMDLQPGMRCLDVGCGNGYAVRAMSELVGASGSVDGVDVSQEMIDRAKALMNDPNVPGLNQTFQVASAQSLPFEDNMFHRILSVEAIYYIPDPKAVAEEFYRVLQPSGSAWIMVDYYSENPYCAQWGTLLDLPIHRLSEADYINLFQSAGFQDVRVARIFDPTPVDVETFKPGWGFDSVEDVKNFRTQVGSLMVTGIK